MTSVRSPRLRLSMLGATLAVVITLLFLVTWPGAAQGNGPESVPKIPGTPTGPAIDAGIVDVEWNEVEGADSYDVQIFLDDSWDDLPGNGNEVALYGTGAIVRNLPDWGRYHFRVRARSETGMSDWSDHLFMPTAGPLSLWEDVPEPVNAAASGIPTISGTAQVGETLMADTSGIADQDGLDDAVFAYQWVAGGTDIDGANGSSYTLMSSEEGQAIQVKVSFTDDADHEETLTSAATAAVAAPSPLTVSLENAETAHDGTNVFTFELRFSEEFELSYTTLKFHAFDVTGGEVLKAQRMDKSSNIRWLITVGPDSDADVSITLPATEDCGDTGAICTEDGRPLSNRLELTVSGPSQ